jgi:hypothetical protein
MRNSSSPDEGTFDKARFEQLKTALADGIDKITTGEDWQRYLEFAARFPSYSFANMMLALAQRPDATMLMPAGYRKNGKHAGWFAVNRVLAPGAQKIWIWAPVMKSRALREEIEAKGQTARPSFMAVPVYDVADTEGDPVPDGAPVTLLTGDDAAGLLELAVKFIEGQGFTVEFVGDVLGGANGDMNPTGKVVRVVTEGRDPRQQAKTALHEAAHVILHSGGKGTGKSGGIDLPRPQKEIEAESAAFIVSMHLGVDTGSYSFGYVADWSASTGFTHKTAIEHSGKRIQRAAAMIIKALGGTVAEDAELEAVAA